MREQRFMDMKSIVEYIPLKTSTIYTMVCKQTIPFDKIGGKLIFDRIEIDEWVKGGRTRKNKLPKLIKIKK
ncbi:helix-turn-helix transcriptional regulator [Halpernia frigidisoli]|uniref:Transcriptional regulator, AlpA family n=1 Tax=Halpernia frigidisoli TaxID=1125876 RepID=A0A1I3FIP1_9FLAO|nr:helix-turn-helix domain-containing protein [Halpernia frigidisoli]SFI11075.1 transcriptional regulator, AlpA family [Halpernia frigidisoli]